MRNREDWLYEQLEQETLSVDLRLEYEAELDARAARHDSSVRKKAEAEAKEAARRADIRARILAGEADFITKLGEDEFGGDYELVQEGDDFIVYSKVARDDQTHRRTHDSLEKAQHDLRYLYYNRMYSKYVRSGELDALVGLVD